MNRQLIHGDCLEELKKLDDNSVDLLCTDPPYGYGFMGKHWDTFKEKDSTKSQQVGWMSPGMKKDTYGMKEFFDPIWKECLRVLKPGALAFVMSAPRSDVQTIMAETLRDAGFDISFTPIYWTYASGFPKAMNMSKMIDKRGAAKQEDLNKWKTWFKEQLDKSKKSNKQINDECGFTATSYCKMDGKDNWTIAFPSKEKWEKIKEVMDLPNDDEYKILEKYTNDRDEFVKQRGHIETTGGLHIADKEKSIKFSGKQLSDNPYSDEAKRFDGAYGGYQPKPAVEVVLVAMKPMDEKGLMAQALKNGKAVSWFDDCRIPFEEGHEPSDNQSMPDLRDVGKKSKEAIGIDKLSYGQVENAERKEYEQNTDGRFPANLLVSDNVLDDGKITKSTGGRIEKKAGWGEFGGGTKEIIEGNPGYGDTGGYSRYFSLDSWFQKNIKQLPEPVQKTFPFMIVPKASKSEKNDGLDNFEVKQKKGGGGTSNNTWYEDDVNSASGKFGSEKAPSRNIHPTVKPLTLMNYLVVLGSRKGDVVLEPFAGSGTTALACVSQERDYIAIEREEEYYEIAKARLDKLEQPLKMWEKFS